MFMDIHSEHWMPCFPAGHSCKQIPSMWHPLPSQLLGQAILQSAPYSPGGHTVDKQYITLGYINSIQVASLSCWDMRYCSKHYAGQEDMKLLNNNNSSDTTKSLASVGKIGMQLYQPSFCNWFKYDLGWNTMRPKFDSARVLPMTLRS